MRKFTKEFKEKAIKLKEQGVHPNDIFKNNDYDISGKQKDYAGKLINRWRKSVPHSKEKEKKIEYLEAQVAYLRAENSFLASLPKKKKN